MGISLYLHRVGIINAILELVLVDGIPDECLLVGENVDTESFVELILLVQTDLADQLTDGLASHGADLKYKYK